MLSKLHTCSLDLYCLACQSFAILAGTLAFSKSRCFCCLHQLVWFSNPCGTHSSGNHHHLGLARLSWWQSAAISSAPKIGDSGVQPGQCAFDVSASGDHDKWQMPSWPMLLHTDWRIGRPVRLRNLQLPSENQSFIADQSPACLLIIPRIIHMHVRTWPCESSCLHVEKSGPLAAHTSTSSHCMKGVYAHNILLYRHPPSMSSAPDHLRHCCRPGGHQALIIGQNSLPWCSRRHVEQITFRSDCAPSWCR